MSSPSQIYLVHMLALTLMASSGCAYRAVAPPPPGPLEGVSSVAVVFDYANLMVNGMGGVKREQEWVAAKTLEEPEYPKTWSDLKAQWEQHFMSAFARSSHVPVSQVAEGTPPPSGGALLKVSMSQFQLGKYIPFATQTTSVQTAQTWWRNDQMVQASSTSAAVTPSITAPSVFQHVRPIGEQSGQQTASTLNAHASRGYGGGGGTTVNIQLPSHPHHPVPFVGRRRW